MYALVYYHDDGVLYACSSKRITGNLIRYKNNKRYKGNVLMKHESLHHIKKIVQQLEDWPEVVVLKEVLISKSHSNVEEPQQTQHTENVVLKALDDHPVSLNDAELHTENVVLKDLDDHPVSLNDAELHTENVVLKGLDDHPVTLNDAELLEKAEKTEHFLMDLVGSKENTEKTEHFLMDLVGSKENTPSSYLDDLTYAQLEILPPLESIDCNLNCIQFGMSSQLNMLPFTSTPRKESKQEFCIFCQKLQCQLARHLSTIHKDENAVKKFLYLPKGNAERKNLIEKLRKEGQLMFNTHPDRERDNKFLSVRRPQIGLKKTREQYKICPNCKGYFAITARRQHVAKCKPELKGQRTVSALGRKLEALAHPDASKKLRDDVMANMTDDEVTKIIRYDFLAVRCGNIWTSKYRNEWDPPMIRNRLRLLGRLLIQIKSLCSTITDLASIFVPQNYDNLLLAINKVANFDEESQTYGAPSTAGALGTLLKEVAKIYNTYLIQTQDETRKKNLKDFIDLLTADYNNSINRTVAENQIHKKHTKKVQLPSQEDIKLLVAFVNDKRRFYFNLFLKDQTVKNYMELASYSLISLLVFNRRRAGEMERLLISNYNSFEEFNKNTDEKLIQSLSEEGQAAINSYIRVVIRGKLGRSVPVIIHKSIKECIDLLLLHRETMGVPSSNRYVFGLPSAQNGSHRYLRACNLMRKYSQECGASDPLSLRGTKLRKHIATQAVMLQLTDNDIIDLATFMGHAEKIHRDHYRLPIGIREVGVLSKMLETAQGQNFQDNDPVETATPLPINSLNEILPNQSHADECINKSTQEDCSSNSDPTNEDCSSDSDQSTAYTGRRRSSQLGSPKLFKFKRVSWSSEEKDLVECSFKNHINNDTSPSLKECQQFLIKHRNKLNRRTATSVKACVSNIVKQKKQPVELVTKSKKRWTDSEIQVVLKEFNQFLKKRVIPTERQCQELKNNYPDILKNRNATMIKTWFYYYLKKLT